MEDETSIRRLLVSLLSAEGYRIQSVADGTLAIRILEDDPDIDLVLTDLAMPGISGTVVAEYLTRTRPKVKIVCMSGNPQNHEKSLRRLLDPEAGGFPPQTVHADASAADGQTHVGLLKAIFKRSEAMDGLFMRWAIARWKAYRLRRRMHRHARQLIRAQEAGPDLLRYMEALEMRVDRQERELAALRWTVKGERMADWDQEQDQLEWRRMVESNRGKHKNGSYNE